MYGTAISGSYVLVQIAAMGAGGPGPDDAIVGLIYEMVDPVENVVSWIGAGFVISADFFSGGSNYDFQTGELIMGQDTIVLGSTATIGQFAGDAKMMGPTYDTIINLAVNTYDVARLSGNVPTWAEIRVDSNGSYVILYDSSN